MIAYLLGDAFRIFSCLQCFGVLFCSAADTHPKLLDHAVSGAQFLTGDVFECDIAHRRSMAAGLEKIPISQ